jgi:poly(3-hydroxybutyrate) depolymerase
MRRPAVALALAAAALTACAADGSGAGPVDPTVPAAQPVSLLRTGGIAGIRETVTVDPGGTWRHDAAGRTSRGTLSAADRETLTRMGADPALPAEATRPRGSNRCADGYELSLTVGNTVVRWSECGPDSDRPPVATQIARLIGQRIN